MIQSQGEYKFVGNDLGNINLVDVTRSRAAALSKLKLHYNMKFTSYGHY